MSDAKTRAGLLEVFCRDVSKTPLLTVAQERRLARAVREGGVRLRAKARAILVESNLRLVFSISTHFTGRGLDLPDLVQEGMVGLITAAERYDERRGTRFSTYACHWIKHAIRAALKNDGRTVRVPSYQWELNSLWEKSAGAIYVETNAPAREEAVLKRVRRKFTWQHHSTNEIDMRSARRFLAAAPAPLDAEDSPLAIADHRTQAAEHVEFRDQVDTVLAAMAGLSKQEQTCLRLRFGLDDDTPRLLREVAACMGHTRERIRQIQDVAMDKLKKALGQAEPVKPPKTKARKRKTGSRHG